MRRSLLATLLLLGATAPALAGDPGGGLNAAAIGMFVGIVIVTLGITYWAAR